MAYSEQFKAEAVLKVIKDGRSMLDVSKELGVSDKQIRVWIDRYREEKHEEIRDGSVSMRACDRVDEVLKKMEQHQIELEQLAYQELLKRISEAKAGEIVNLLNITTNQFKSANGKATDVVQVKGFSDFLKEYDND